MENKKPQNYQQEEERESNSREKGKEKDNTRNALRSERVKKGKGFSFVRKIGL